MFERADKFDGMRSLIEKVERINGSSKQGRSVRAPVGSRLVR